MFCDKMKKETHGLWKTVKSMSGHKNATNWESLIENGDPEKLVNVLADKLHDKYQDDSHFNNCSFI